MVLIKKSGERCLKPTDNGVTKEKYGWLKKGIDITRTFGLNNNYSVWFGALFLNVYGCNSL